MIVYLNGRYVAAEDALVSVFDRGFLYGDGLFETVRIAHGRPFRWQEHWQRLCRGAEFLTIKVPLGAAESAEVLSELIDRNKKPESLARVSLTRGVGVRGYSPQGADQPTIVISLHELPPGTTNELASWHLVTASQRLLSNSALAQFKTCNKLPQVMARAEADAAAAHEAVLLNHQDQLVEGSRSNLFWIRKETVWTAPLAAGVLPGVTRQVVLELCQRLNVRTDEAGIIPEQLRECEGVFFSLSSEGITEGISIDGHPLKRSALVKTLHQAYGELLRTECQERAVRGASSTNALRASKPV